MLDSLLPFGDHAYRVVHRSSALVAAWAEAVRRAEIPGVVDVVAAYETAAVFLHPDMSRFEAVVERLQAVAPLLPERTEARTIDVPVRYDGVDLADVAARLRLDRDEVIDAHASRLYRVAAIGFRPGFPYLDELPESLCGLPRRESPRAAVPAGSVAIVGRQTAIYPEVSPGGWHLIARTPLQLVDLKAGWFAFRVGDLLRFRPIDDEEFDAIRQKGRVDAIDGSERGPGRGLALG